MATKKRTLTDKLARMSEDERENWAAERQDEITPEHAVALDILGWKIVSKEDCLPWWKPLWRVDGRLIGDWIPTWCQDIASWLEPDAKVVPAKGLGASATVLPFNPPSSDDQP